MKRLLPLLLLLAATTAFAQTAETHRYLVATRPGVHKPAAIDNTIDFDSRDTVAFHLVDGFAADLTDAEAAQLAKSPQVRWVERAAPRHALATPLRNINGQTKPYGISEVHADTTWPVVKGDAINVVVMDTGVDYTHPDLRDQYAGGTTFIPKTTTPMDDNGHGTHVAGIALAEDNTLGVVGVAPHAKLWAVKVLGSDGSGNTGYELQGLQWVVDQKNKMGGNWVVNLSLGDTVSNALEQAAFQRAIDAGILIVAAAGNESTAATAAPIDYPAAYPGVLAIGAVDASSSIADFSCQGPQLALVAPGVDVLSTLPVGKGSIGYLNASGNTYGAPGLEGSAMGSLTSTFVDCGFGNPGDFPPSVKGHIALIHRGSITFAEKARNAVAAGASAVVIVNKDDSDLSFTLYRDGIADDKTFAWPIVVAVSLADGNTLAKTPNAPITVTYRTDDYGVLSGTSMATPHAAGVAALVWSAAPNATAAQVTNALLVTAHDLGTSGFDPVYGHGLADAEAAARMLAPSLFGSGATPPPAPGLGTGRRILRHF
jgi:serine protease